MKKLVLTLFLIITAACISIFGGCSNGKTYGGEKMQQKVEQNLVEQKRCEKCGKEGCDGTCQKDCKKSCPNGDCKENCPNGDCEQEDLGDFKARKIKPRARMPRMMPDGNGGKHRRPMPISPLNPEEN